MKKHSELKDVRLGAGFRCGWALVALCGLGLTSLSGIAQADMAQDGSHRKVRKPVTVTVPVEVAPEPVAVAPPPPPLTPGQMAPNAPSVVYEDGQLSITAENSTMADILSAVGASTGATIEVPAGAGAERVWIQLGPGPARAILASLLSGTDLDYVIQAADADPAQIQSVLLTPRTKGPRVGDGASGSQSFASRLSNRFRNRGASGAPDTSDSDSGSTPDNTASAPDADPASAAATVPPAQAAAAPTAPDSPNAPLSARLPSSITEAEAHPAPIPNPEQGVPQLLNLFELRRQLQEQQNAQQKSTASSR